MTILLQLRDGRSLNIDEPLSALVTGGSAYLSRSGRSVAVTLHGPRNPRYPDIPVPTHRVYLPLDWIESATDLRHLLNAAAHKSHRWLDNMRADYWRALVVIACRPMRDKCKPLLQAIGKVAHQHYGQKYWRRPEGRALLRRELSLMGIQCPPDGAAIEFLTLAKD
jgi:hypothetical protein